MNTLNEIKHFCEEENTFGALMLTGKWGCGKTYLIDNELQKALGNDYIVVRISLFGETSVDGIRKLVQKEYFNYAIQNPDVFVKPDNNEATTQKNPSISSFFTKSNAKKAAELIKTAKTKGSKFNNVISTLSNIAKSVPILEKVLTIDLTTLVPIDPKLGDKKVILVFDDLERSMLNSIEILGCINEYCENKRIKTIVVANEEKILEKDNAKSPSAEDDDNAKPINYKEIKEKIISRTLKCVPDFKIIITHIIAEEYISKNSDYKEFLYKNIDTIYDLFCTGKSENIRSLKCALQDFYRIYAIMQSNGFVREIKKYLSSFVCFVLFEKEGRKRPQDDIWAILSDAEIKEVYPNRYFDSFMFAHAKKWIVEGVLDESGIIEEINEKLRAMRSVSAEEKVLDSYFVHLDEDTIEEGFQKAIEIAYTGKLMLNQYIILLANISWARSIPYDLPVEIDWSKFKDGVLRCLKALQESDEKEPRVHTVLDKTTMEDLNESEREIYTLITEFRENNVHMFSVNKRLYLNALISKDVNRLFECENKRFNEFDVEMAAAIYNTYKDLSNSERQVFNAHFKQLWLNSFRLQDIDIAKSIKGFEELQKKISELSQIELETKYKIKASFCKKLLELVLVTLDNYEKALEQSRKE